MTPNSTYGPYCHWPRSAEHEAQGIVIERLGSLTAEHLKFWSDVQTGSCPGEDEHYRYVSLAERTQRSVW